MISADSFWSPEENLNSVYDKDSWRLYCQTVMKRRKKGVRGERQDRGTYLPTPDEICQRAADLMWLQNMEFSKRFIHAVMDSGNPSIYAVVYAVQVKGLSVQAVEAALLPKKINGHSRLARDEKKGRRAKKEKGSR